MLYLRAHVHDFGLPEWVDQLTPLIEFNFTTPVTDRYGAKTVGTIFPGIVWAGEYVQFGVEAIIPTTRASGNNVGIIAQLHFYLNDIFPRRWAVQFSDIEALAAPPAPTSRAARSASPRR